MSGRATTALLLASGLALAGTSEAAPPPDPASVWTFQIENDAVSTLKGTSDQYYTSGLRLGWTSGSDLAPGFLRDFARSWWGDGRTRVAVDIAQSIFTPRNTQISPPDPHDRPYAGWLHADFSLLHDTDQARSQVVLSLGVVGPSALGREVQNGFHSLIGDPSNKGWHYQLPDEPALEVISQHTWRLPLAQFGPGGALETDALPSVALGLGTVRDYLQAGVRLRLGQGLGSDFGPARILPGLDGADAYTPVRPFSWYVFVGADGQGVARDVFLDGSTFRSRPGSHVSKKWYMGEFEAGVGVIWHGVRLSYTQTWQTEAFNGQKGGLFNFGSLAASVRF